MKIYRHFRSNSQPLKFTIEFFMVRFLSFHFQSQIIHLMLSKMIGLFR